MMLARPNQSLSNHIENVVKLSTAFAQKIHIDEPTRIAALFHDLGKNAQAFQDYLNGKTPTHEGGHSGPSAKHLYAQLTAQGDNPLAHLLANVVLGHHGTLYDHVSHDGETPVMDKIEAACEVTAYGLTLAYDFEKAKQQLCDIVKDLPRETLAFAMSFLTKFVYSCLVDADRLDAYNSEVEQVYQEPKANWDNYLSKLDIYLQSKQQQSTPSPMNTIRQQVSDQCEVAGRTNPKGAYTLNIGTGAGKTLSSLRFALNHAKAHNMDRVIYVIPYLSIIDQTAQELTDLLGTGVVLAHHSGAYNEDESSERSEEERAKAYKLHTDRWDKPIIITTMVQFLESAFSSKAGKLRKFHNMSNAVLIFDEIQSLPIKCTYLFTSLINFLNQVGGSTILLCSATQPPLQDSTLMKKPLVLTSDTSIATADIPSRTHFMDKRLPGGYSHATIADMAMDVLDDSMLLIFNTKKDTLAVYQEIAQRLGNQSDTALLHLSTSMCPKHRKDVIATMRTRLANKQQVICVSTQLIEAGVDISFGTVIRAATGIDSIHQAAGRCNRHGEYNQVRPVYIINVQGENLDMLPDMKQAQTAGLQALNDGRDLGESPNITDYYGYYLQEQQDTLWYPTKNKGSVYDLLAKNPRGVSSLKNRRGSDVRFHPPHAIKTASDEFFVIDEKGTLSVVVDYDQSQQLLDTYDSLAEWEVRQKVNLLKQLAEYTIDLYSYQEKALSGAITQCKGVYRLNTDHYKEAFGLDMLGTHELLMM